MVMGEIKISLFVHERRNATFSFDGTSTRTVLLIFTIGKSTWIEGGSMVLNAFDFRPSFHHLSIQQSILSC